MTVSSRRLTPFVLLLAVAATALAALAFAPPFAPRPARSSQTTATYLHGRLFLSIPYQAARAGTGQLTLELLDPEDHVLGHSERALNVATGPGSWQESLSPNKPIPFEDLVWQRVRWRFTFDDHTGPIEGTASLSEILRRPVVHILGQTQYLTGSDAALRAIVTDGSGTPDAPVDSGTFRIELVGEKTPTTTLFTGKLNHRGTVDAHFHLPANLTGRFHLHFIAETPIGTSESTQPVTLADKAAILLTTEKPLYQPGQAIHIRALALDRADHKATAAQPLTFEIEDSRGNKVFKARTKTDAFGIASAEFQLADEVNLGTYHLRALMGDPDNPANTAEIALNVERYVLPKFKVDLEFTPSNGKPKRDFRPGDHVTGTVHATYFFGKPVDHAQITVKVSAMDVALFEAASTTGKTDAQGDFHFDLRLPSYFAGAPLSQGAARALVEASVVDSAAHTEARGEPITISQSGLLITAVPEGGTLIPHLDNQVFVLASYPDGTPAQASLTVHAGSSPIPELIPNQQKVTTDAGGVAIIHLKPSAGQTTLRIDADDHHGTKASSIIELDPRDGSDQILLRTDRAILKPGDRLNLHVLSTRATGAAYIDLVRNGQTVMTRDVDLVNGQADIAVTITPEMAGTLDLDAYLFGRDSQPIADHRLVFVQPADELHIETVANAAEYRPGGEARVKFHVTNAHGQGVSAALGVQVVDETVFALAEKQPGFAKVFFYLEQEVMKPRFEIHSLSPEQVVTPIPSPRPVEDAQPDLDARALFSATEIARPNTLNAEFGRTLPTEKQSEYQARYQAVFLGEVKQVMTRLNQHPQHIGALNNPDKIHRDFIANFENTRLANGQFPRDSWGTPLRITSADRWATPGHFSYKVVSAGPDQVFDTPDDLITYLTENTNAPTPTQHNTNANAVRPTNLTIEHDRGPMNNRAEITGSVVDPTGAIIPNATVTLSGGRQTTTNAQGQFTFAALPAGTYEITIESPGFVTLRHTNIALKPRDHAILTGTLNVGFVSETVEVAAETTPFVELGMPPRPVMLAMGRAVPIPAPMASKAMNFMAADAAGLSENVTLKQRDRAAAPGEPAAPHVRSYFPEALYINPEILTDGHGNAAITIPIADSITTWRMALMASTQAGALGSGTASLKVFQPFFVDLDLPVTLTQGDRVTLPVALYNYTGNAGQVSLTLDQQPWFELQNDTSSKLVNVDSNRVGSASFSIEARRIGKFKLILKAHMPGVHGAPAHDDIVVREIEVIPNGREQNLVFNGRLDGGPNASTAEHTLLFPANAIPDATTLFIRLYPGPLSQLVEGMDSILRMPYGCFEQTSSATYPNILALDYMKQSKKLTPEVHAKAEGFIATGYQRLLTFEVPGGGFSWFGEAPANKILTAYGLMEFHDMAQVAQVDPKLIQRTSAWLVAQQQPDGSWKPDTRFINEGATNRFNTDVLRITAYVAWSLANSGYQGPATAKAQHYIETHASQKPDPYTLAVIANFAVDSHTDADFTRRAMQALLDARQEKDDTIFWSSEETGVYSRGASAQIETTGLAAQALLKWGQASGPARKALTFLTHHKQADGTWGTTQATIMALRSLLLASRLSAADTRGTVQILVDNKPFQTLKLTAENSDLLHQFVVKNPDPSHPSQVQLRFEGTGGLAYQVAGRYFTPYESQAPNRPALAIDVTYDRATLAENDIATATATIHNNLRETANMIMVDLGIPPGFELLSEDLQSFQEKTSNLHGGKLEKFSQTATQAILYFDGLAPGQTVTLHFRLRAKYPVRARTFQSRVYEYYDPAVSATAAPVVMEVHRR
jgi:hypothetical protein